ncbi:MULTISPECIES: signal recognition particle protein [Ruminococcus]|jgi:signal recognition particle subunit SRP54|uniref:Signal recognition particle protein n=1 Tax=Ruminococcus flavefaciens TaxID=1265 RepID=A0A315Y1R3_RUMFL|nr:MULTISPECIES: signal recognition particle protein [Ruminococcus]MBQ6168886.1 signal recognition particle protein [Ruminococcus sp.]MBR1430115.1 signal recognition particle protein [Ruminococcus sp.]PWJ13373.1 signal recognition particle subunit FFH/SRP54 (srp54) [Ruminococcus flavefaciens]SSA47857.1 signal recognition particle subunit FFH/SRP54 (srp54) [Ruminococcus flavefaciens]HOA00187.1 signal recognition particle protein [Ruminococcus sp.]
MAFEGLSEKLNNVFKKLKSRGKLTESDVKEAMREVRLALLEADVSYKVVKDFVKSVTERAVGEEVLASLTPAQQVIKIVNEELVSLMGNSNARINMASKPPTVIMMCGLQGSGKTTHAAKLAKLLKKEGHRPLLAACDIYRPAAINQLQVVGGKADVKVFEMGQTDPVVIAKKALAYAKDYGHDILIIDTAGRLHIDEALMDELVNIKKETNPDEIMLVVDAMTGQDAVNVAKAFDDAVGITGVLMSKLDSDTRGGAALSVLSVTGKPIKFVGMGEKLDDFEQFHPERMASRILGMGDVLTLIEKAENVMSQKDAEKLTKKFKENKFDMDDLLDQMKQIKRMGSMKSILGMLPGVGDKIKDADIDESQLGRIEAMITSMTKAERAKPSIINPSRKKRIANGSGTKVEDVNRLLKQFDQMQTMMKKFTGKSGKMSLRKARKNLAGMNFDKYTGKGGGNLPF